MRVGVSSRPHFRDLGVPLRGKGYPFPGGGRIPHLASQKNPVLIRYSPSTACDTFRKKQLTCAGRVATSPSWAPLTRYQPLATARAGGSSCISRRRLPLAEVALGDLLGARFSPRGHTKHVLRAAWDAEIWLVIHGHDTGRGHGAAGRALSLGHQPACALENSGFHCAQTAPSGRILRG